MVLTKLGYRNDHPVTKAGSRGHLLAFARLDVAMSVLTELVINKASTNGVRLNVLDVSTLYGGAAKGFSNYSAD